MEHRTQDSLVIPSKEETPGKEGEKMNLHPLFIAKSQSAYNWVKFLKGKEKSSCSKDESL
jgi:hypothetical protein